jgi:hypothetical protein
MSVRSSASPRSNLVYTLLFVAGVVAAIVGAWQVADIAYNYATREELRNPPPRVEEEGGHATLPEWIVSI